MKFSGLKGWWDASQITGLNHNEAITTLYDLSGNGNDLAQSTTSKKPLYKTDSGLHLPYYVYFDGSNDYLYKTFGSSLSWPVTIILVGRVRSKDCPLDFKVIFGNHTDGTHVLYFSSDTLNFLQLYADSDDVYSSYIGPSINTFCLFTTHLNTTNCYVRNKKNPVLFMGSAASSTMDGFALGGNQDTSFCDLDMMECMIYNKTLSDYELYQIETYLAKKWGIKTYSLIAQDNFNRTNNASSMGNCLSNQVWTAGSYQDTNMPTIGINSNMGYFPSISGTDSHAYIETGISDCVITVQFTYASNSDKGIIFRRVDGNNYFYLHLNSSSDNLVLSRCLAGSRSDLSSIALTTGTGSPVMLRCFLSGSSIKCGMYSSYGNASYIETTDANLTTATKHGLYNQSGTAAAFDSFFIADY